MTLSELEDSHEKPSKKPVSGGFSWPLCSRIRNINKRKMLCIFLLVFLLILVAIWSLLCSCQTCWQTLIMQINII